jgi:hypothetical protein
MSSGSMIIMSTTMSTNFMKFYTVTGIFFFLIESNITEIIPDGEECCSYYIGKEDLIEHEEYPEWEDDILTRYHKCIKH